MKNKVLAFGAAIIASLALITQATAGYTGALQDFNLTNYLTIGTQGVSGWPTNIAGYGTGQAASLAGIDSFGLLVQGEIYTTNATSTNATISVTLIPSFAGGGGPQMTLGTNAYQSGVTNIMYTDWPTYTTGGSSTVVVFTTPQGVTNQWVSFVTNFPSTTIISCANWVGVSNIVTSGLGTGGFITNLDVKIIGKTKVAPWSF
jgi:hypothetical protein